MTESNKITKLNKIDYAIISVDDNPEYADCISNVQNRWNQLGIGTIVLKVHKGRHNVWRRDIILTPNTLNHEIHLYCNDLNPRVLHKYFVTTIVRFWFASHPMLLDKVLVISDADLIPINKRYIFQPAYKFPMNQLLSDGKLVCTNQYAEGDFPSTFTYGLGSTWKSLFDFDSSLQSVIDKAEEYAWESHTMYLREEQYMNHLYREHDNICIGVGNRFYREGVQEMNNLYDHQIDFLNSPTDLAPFVELHSFSATSMSKNNRWYKLFRLLEDYDKLDICPNCWFWNTLPDPWRDTVVTKNGLVILGDEYDDKN